MASGTNSATFPMAIREVINLLCRRYNMLVTDATSVVYALLESGLLAEETYALRFMDTQVLATVTLEELDAIVRQLAEGKSSEGFTYTPESLSAAGQGLRLAATVPLGLAISSLDGVESMRNVFSSIIGSARKMLRVSSPYIEQSGLNLILGSFEVAAGNRARLRLLTRIDNCSRPKIHKILAILTLHDIFGEGMEVRSFAKTVGQGHHWLSLGGVHAKLLVADGSQAYVGSGEIRDHSLNRNFEVGLAVDDPEVVALISHLFDAVWDMSSEVAVEYCRSFMR